MNVELVNPFIHATLEVLGTMAQTQPKPEKPQIKGDNKTWGDVTGVIGMAGEELSGNLVISFDQPSILGIVSRMLMEQFSSLSPEVVDAVGEITNMISGGAKRGLSEKGFKFSMATPIMLTGKNVEIKQYSNAAILQVPFVTPEGRFVIEANLAPIAKR